MTNAQDLPSTPTFEGRPLHDPTEPVFDQGLTFDVETLLARRRVLQGIGLAAVSVGLVACGAAAASPSASSAARASSSAAVATSTAACSVIPEETAGPFPGDGSNGPDLLTASGVVRSDIRSSFGSSTTTAPGVPLTIRLTILDNGNGCAPLAGAAVYVWHCSQAGAYSMYGQGVENENYLRGIQVAGSDGTVRFSSIFPAAYSGRWPHVHFEVYPSLDKATSVANKIATSQIALPEATCAEVYATAGYEQSVQNMARTSLKTDNVFGNDGGVQQIGTVTGSVAAGLTVDLAVPVSA
jgi:protocatechuate 3,4-dioxygenase beta subunit